MRIEEGGEKIEKMDEKAVRTRGEGEGSRKARGERKVGRDWGAGQRGCERGRDWEGR